MPGRTSSDITKPSMGQVKKSYEPRPHLDSDYYTSSPLVSSVFLASTPEALEAKAYREALLGGSRRNLKIKQYILNDGKVLRLIYIPIRL